MTAYQKVWPEGWKDNEDGGTYIDAAGLNHIEDGIIAATNAVTAAESNIQDLTAQDATVLRNAKQYSDGNLATAKSYTDTADGNLRSLIAEKLSTTYKAGGSVAFSALPALTAENLGVVVNVSESFTTNASFVEGAGKTHPAGTNVVVALSGSAYKYDVLAGFVDLSAYATTANVNTQLNGKADKSAMTTELSKKVNVVAGKQLSTNDYTTAEKQKLEGIESEAQVNEVSANQYASVLGALSLMRHENESLRTTLNNLIAGLDMPLLVMSMSGTKGYAFIEDAASGSVYTITVDPKLSGTTLYIQVRDVMANTIQSITAVVGSSGNVPVTNATTARLHVAYGTNQIYVAKTAYVWNNRMSATIGSDGYPVNGVDFTITYSRDKMLGAEVDRGYLTWDDLLEINGYEVTRTAYASTAAAIAAFNRGETVVVKVKPSLNGPRIEYTNPITTAPSPASTLSYYHETYSLRS